MDNRPGVKTVQLVKYGVMNWTKEDEKEFNAQYNQNDKCGVGENLATLEFEIKMKSEHDEKGRFSIGFLIVDYKDGNGPKLGIFDDDRKIIGVIPENDKAIKILDSLLETRKSRHVFTYLYPTEIKKWRKEEQGYGTKRIRLHTFDQKTIDGFQLSKDIILQGKITDDQMTNKWRIEN